MIPNPCYKCTVPPRPVPISPPLQWPPSWCLCSHVRLCSELGYGKGGVSAAKVVPFVLASAVTAHLVRQPSGSVYYSDVGDRPESESHSGSNVRSHTHMHTLRREKAQRHIHSARHTSQWVVADPTSLHAQERSTSRQQPALGVVNPSLRGKKCGGVLLLVASAFPEGIEKGTSDRAKFLDDHSSTAG
jgi:hypothetical protein